MVGEVGRDSRVREVHNRIEKEGADRREGTVKNTSARIP